MDFGMFEDIYLAISRIFDGFVKFLYEIFGDKKDEE